MINKLKGIVTEKIEKTISITIFDSISFQIFVLSIDDFVLNEEYLIYIEMVFSAEKGYILYGFLDLMQRKYFVILKDCHGIGSKIALTILQHLTVNQIYQAIIEENKLIFESISGIGKKKAEMLILELKSKIYKFPIMQIDNNQNILQDDLIESLKVLGYNKKEIMIMLRNIDKADVESNIPLGKLIEKVLLRK